MGQKAGLCQLIHHANHEASWGQVNGFELAGAEFRFLEIVEPRAVMANFLETGC